MIRDLIKQGCFLSSFILVGSLFGCVTPNHALKIPKVDRPLATIQSIVSESLPLGRRAVSPNGREFLSKFFVTKNQEYVPADTASRRWFAHVFVLNDRRPYGIEILVKRERRVSRRGVLSYAPDGLDLRIANNLKNKLTEELSKRREDSNIIDDFRAF